MSSENLLAVFVSLDKLNRSKATSLGGDGEASNSGEKVEMCSWLLIAHCKFKTGGSWGLEARALAQVKEVAPWARPAGKF